MDANINERSKGYNPQPKHRPAQQYHALTTVTGFVYYLYFFRNSYGVLALYVFKPIVIA